MGLLPTPARRRPRHLHRPNPPPRRNPDLPLLGATRDKHGNVTYLHKGDFQITPTGTWPRDATCTYPSGWQLTVLGRHYTVTPVLKNQELRSVYPTFWDGETNITGGAQGQGVAELLNYCYAPQPLELLD
ncbi:MAG: lipocalin family protein [Solirubrobacteraceae bacterium]